jgi:hypothetical protein
MFPWGARIALLTRVHGANPLVCTTLHDGEADGQLPPNGGRAHAPQNVAAYRHIRIHNNVALVHSRMRSETKKPKTNIVPHGLWRWEQY